MAFEVTLPSRGVLRTRDLRAALGDAFLQVERVDVLVLNARGRVPIATSITLVDLVAGRRVHRALACPNCSGPRRVLIARANALVCKGCARARTRQQLERTRADWCRRGGCEEDRLLRLASRQGLSQAGVEEVARLAARIVEDDRLRFAQLSEQIAVVKEIVSAASRREGVSND